MGRAEALKLGSARQLDFPLFSLPRTGPSFAGRPAKVILPSAACRSSGAKLKTSSGRAAFRGWAGPLPSSQMAGYGSPPQLTTGEPHRFA